MKRRKLTGEIIDTSLERVLNFVKSETEKNRPVKVIKGKEVKDSTIEQKTKSKQEIMSFYRNNPEGCFGAGKIDKALNYDPGGTKEGYHKSWSTHSLLQDLAKEGFLKQCHGKGFCLSD